MISLRLTQELEQKINKLSKAEKTSKSDIIKRALDFYFKDYQKKQNPYELGKDLFGKYGSANGNLSKDYKNILKEKLREKHSH